MWEQARGTMTDEQLADRSALLEQLGEMMHREAGSLGLVAEGCRRVCKEQLELVNGRLRRVLICKVICD